MADGAGMNDCGAEDDAGAGGADRLFSREEVVEQVCERPESEFEKLVTA